MKKIILPKKDKEGNQYLSYSQISKWMDNKGSYFDSYFFGTKQRSNAYLVFGSKVGEALEKNDFSKFTVVERKALSKVTRLDEFEREVKLKQDGFYVLGYIDTNDKDLKMLIDYKTTTLENFDKYKKDNYIQLHIYALAIEQETGKLPEEIKVIGIDRKGNPFKNTTLKVGGDVFEHTLDLSDEKLDYTKNIVEDVAGEISDHYKAYLKMMEYEVDYKASI